MWVKKFTCGDCGKEFPYKKSMARDIRAQHQGLVYKCPTCDLDFKYKSSRINAQMKKKTVKLD